MYTDHHRITTQHWIVCRPSQGYHPALNRFSQGYHPPLKCIQTIIRFTIKHWIVYRPSQGYHPALNCTYRSSQGYHPALNCIQTTTRLPSSTEVYTDHHRITTQHWIVYRPALNCIQTITGLPPSTELYIQIITGLPPSIELYTDHQRNTTHPIVYNYWMRVRHCESCLTTLQLKNIFIKTSQLTISSPMH